MVYIHLFWFVLVVLSVLGDERCKGSLGFQCPYDAYPDPGCFPKEFNSRPLIMERNVTPIDINRYPYVVSLQTLKCGNHVANTGCYEHFCGGTMIASNLILTAAHCFNNLRQQNAQKRLDGQLIYRPNKPVYAAISPECRHLSNEKYGRFQVHQIIIHPGYQQKGSIQVNDVAIVDIFRNKKGEFYNGPLVEIVTENTTEDVSHALVLGYGIVHPDDASKYVVKYVRDANVELMEEKQFCQYYLNIFDNFSSKLLNYTNMMCYFDLHADACEGDSGGPLLLEDKDIQIGLVSWGAGKSCLDVDAMQAPGIYVRLSFFANWIYQIKHYGFGEISQASMEPTQILANALPTLAPPTSEVSIQQLEADSLFAFKNSIRNSSNLSSWSGTNACNNWLGISCSNGRVIDISLGETIYNLDDVSKNIRRTPFVQNIQTSLPDQWSILDKLQRIQLGNTRLTGLLPPWISKMQDLTVFDADNGTLQGTLPVEYSMLSNLRLFYAKINGLEGPLPVQYSTLASLQYVSLWNNNLTGTLPTQYSKFVNLVNLYLERNELQGSVPPQYTSWGSTPYIILFPQKGDLLCLDKNHESIVDGANIIFC